MVPPLRRSHPTAEGQANRNPEGCSRVSHGAALRGEALGTAKAQEGSMKVWIYVDTNRQVGDIDLLKVFANDEAAEIWFEKNDPEGVAFE
jgi:hypothetical protein